MHKLSPSLHEPFSTNLSFCPMLILPSHVDDMAGQLSQHRKEQRKLGFTSVNNYIQMPDASHHALAQATTQAGVSQAGMITFHTNCIWDKITCLAAFTTSECTI